MKISHKKVTLKLFNMVLFEGRKQARREKRVILIISLKKFYLHNILYTTSHHHHHHHHPQQQHYKRPWPSFLFLSTSSSQYHFQIRVRVEWISFLNMCIFLLRCTKVNKCIIFKRLGIWEFCAIIIAENAV